MIDILYILSISLYAVINYLVRNWMTIYVLGFRNSTPTLFLEKPQIYGYIKFFLLLFTSVLAYFSSNFSLVVSIILITITWLLSNKYGRNKAYNRYREIFNTLAEAETDSQKLEEYKKGASASNKELGEKVETMTKLYDFTSNFRLR